MIFDHQFGAFTKHADSDITVAQDYTNDLATGETVSSCTVTAVDEDETDATSTVISSTSVTSPYVYVNVAAGTAGQTYEIKIKATTSQGHVITRYVVMDVVGDVGLNPKLGDSDANSYVNLKEANDYIKNSFYHGDQWDKLSFEGRKRLLIQACKDINMINFKDSPYYSSQSLPFPRSNHQTYIGTASINTATKVTLRGLNLYSTTYNKIPNNHFKYGTVHIREGTNLDQTRYISSSTASEGGAFGEVVVSSPFDNNVVASDQYLIFEPIYQEVKDAQCEQAMYIIENKLYLYADYKDVDISALRTGDLEVEFGAGEGTMPHKISLKAKKLLSRHARKTISYGRA